MMLLRTLRSSAARKAATAARTAFAPTVTSQAQRILSTPSVFRFFAAEAGFLDRSDVSSRVLEVVGKFEKVQPKNVTEASHFVNDLGLDSLDVVEVVMAFEDEFNIEIPDEAAEKMMSCDDAIEYLVNNVHAE